ncbi:nuclear transport factor 2 family protein [Roseibium sp. MMSF_3544]|uniref:nuclear transport factor 2 family protein n=1 Tax=unclassified Roseibium TaxID=2629323 RepID=UPI00273F9238|nr:nuclear transport factor 2 family protein [Roseibium sp. MMSF_3544]
MRFIQAFLALALVFASAHALADETIKLGSPITSENIADVFEMQRIASVLGDGFDREDWDAIITFFADEVSTTSGAAVKGVPEIKTKEQIVTRWESLYSSVDELIVHHFTSNERVFFHDKDNASMFSKGVIVGLTTPGGDKATTGGTLKTFRWIDYEYGFTRTEDGWKVNKLLVDYIVDEAVSLAASQ